MVLGEADVVRNRSVREDYKGWKVQMFTGSGGCMCPLTISTKNGSYKALVSAGAACAGDY